MFLFVFQNHKHRMSVYDKRRKNLDSTHGQFDLAVIRSGLTDKHTIYGHGTYPLQQELEKHEIQHKITGHILEVSDSRLAVWIKLNHENLSRGKAVKLVASYEKIEYETVKPLFDKLSDLKERLAILSNENYNLDSAIRYMKGFEDKSERLPDLTLDIWNQVSRLKADLRDHYKIIDSNRQVILAEMTLLKATITEYMKDRKLT